MITSAPGIAQTAQEVGLWVALVASFTQNAYMAFRKARNDNAVHRIEAQLKPNGGDSFKDAMSRVESIVASVETKLDALTHEVTLQRSLQRMIADMDDTYVTWVAAPTGEWEFLSLGITKITGRQVESLKGSNWLNMIDPNDREKVAAQWWEAVQRKHNIELNFQISGPKLVPAVMRGYVAEAPRADLFAGWTGSIEILK